MLYTGFYIIFALLIIKKLSNFTKINLGILIGIIIPDMGVILEYLNIYSESHGSILHSLTSILLMYIFLLILNEIYKNKINIRMINGILLGALIHLFFDILLSNGNIIFFWPLPITTIESIFSYEISDRLLYILASMQFLFLRYFGYKINNGVINCKRLNPALYKNVIIINYWMNYQVILLVLFLSLMLFNVNFPHTLLNFSVISSLVVLVFSLSSIKGSFYRGNIIG